MSVRDVNSAAQIAARIAKGWKPNRYLTNMSMAYFANQQTMWQQAFFLFAR